MSLNLELGIHVFGIVILFYMTNLFSLLTEIEEYIGYRKTYNNSQLTKHVISNVLWQLERVYELFYIGFILRVI